MSDGPDGPRTKPRWRRKWTRTPPGRRGTAAAALGDLFQRPRPSFLVLGVLAGSAVCHLALVPLLGVGRGKSLEDLEATENAYLRKVLQKRRAAAVSRQVSGKITMPPPPEDPEEFVSKTMDASLGTDIDKVIGDMLDVEVTSQIRAKVSASLKEELRAAARKIAEKKLSQKEIQDLQEAFRRKAHEAALGALKEYRIETQVKRAAVSTTRWYEESVGPVLFTNLRHELYGRPSWNVGPRIWYTTWPGGNGNPRWHDLRSLKELSYRREDLHELIKGWIRADRDDRYKIKAKKDAKGRTFIKDHKGRNLYVVHEAWPGPNLAQARLLKRRLHAIYNRTRGGYKNQETVPSWNDYIYESKVSCGVLQEFHPHRTENVRPVLDKLDALWKRAFARVAEYLRLEEDRVEESEIRPVHQDCFDTLKQILEESAKLYPEHHAERDYRRINHALRLEVLRDPDLQTKCYREWVEQMTTTLEALIRDYAEGQFLEGIIKRDGTVEEALEKFPGQILPLVRRDVLRLLPEDKFKRIIFYPYKHRSPITNDRQPPSDAQYKEDHEVVEKLKTPDRKAYADARRKLLRSYVERSVGKVIQELRRHVFMRGLLTKRIHALAEGVDYADKVKQKLDARKAAKEGRGQDLARLNKQGLPDTAARRVALRYGLAKGGLVEPVTCRQTPGFVTEVRPGEAIRPAMPRLPPRPAKWGRVTQARPDPPFKTSAFEAIPFLSRFPRLDGDLSDWGEIRPLILRPYRKGSRAKRPILLYAAWNYQGYFFGYRVDMPAEDFFHPEQYRTKARRRPDWEGGGYRGSVRTVREKGCQWMLKGDHLRLLFDTLDARLPTRGDPHTQEFIILPMGSDTNPALPGYERMFESRRKAKRTDWRDVVASGRLFLNQPPRKHGPDGTGPYRVAKRDDEGPLSKQGYTVEVFIPRSLFREPVFAPGWYIGFDAAVATGWQGRFNGQHWGPLQDAVPDGDGPGLCPRKWGDLLMLGTDPFIVVQDADRTGTRSDAIVPGHSYLLSVIDPDRNVYTTAKDSVLVSAEVAGSQKDIEVFLLMETEDNSGIFRGYVDTQPGAGRKVQGVLEVMAGQEVRLGYVDLGTAQGERNVVFELRLPVLAPVTSVARSR
jgi:hypothetical protein